jgi:hypothetical protein
MKTSDAVTWAGGTQTLLGEKLGMAQSSIASWGESPPWHRQLEIQMLSRGRLKADPRPIKKAKPVPAAQRAGA